MLANRLECSVLYIVVPETMLQMFEPQTVRIMVAKKTFLTFCYDRIQLVTNVSDFYVKVYLDGSCMPTKNKPS